MGKKKDKSLGISVKKEENIVDWYSEVVQKAELADPSHTQGFMVIRPRAYFIWEKIQEEFNKFLEKTNVRNAYFPLLIPKSSFEKEKDHVEGFDPQLAYVENSGEGGEKLAIRPTSETIIYDSFAKWIRSYRDLPLKINQWCNVLRWEVSQTKLFLRTREFLWQEGHCAFANKKEAYENMQEVAEEYKRLSEELLAIPVLVGEKSELERFPGAEMTTGIETLMPDGKALQYGTSHVLKEGFSSKFGVNFVDENEKRKEARTTSWGFSTRMIGGLIMMHGDDRGLVLPPKVAREKIAIVPIVFKDKGKDVEKKAKEISKKLKKYGAILDDREGYSPGWKFNEWDLKGVPLRIEIGPRDLEKKQVTLVRRDTGKKLEVKEKDILKKIDEELEKMQKDMLAKARKKIKEKMDSAENIKELKKKVKEGKIVKIYMKNSKEIEEKIKEETGGANSRIIEKVKKKGKCLLCGEEVDTIAYIARNY